MNIRPVSIALALSSSIVLSSCGGPGSFSNNYPNAVTTISPHISTIAVNGTQVFTVTVTNAPSDAASKVSWSVIGSSSDPTVLGSFSNGTKAATGATVTYTAPAQSPLYTTSNGSGNTVYDGGGNILISAASQYGPFLGNGDSVNLEILGPIRIAINPVTSAVKLGTTTALSAYDAGSTNQNITWEVNGVAGGSTATGTIALTHPQETNDATYTAPTAMPIAGNTVTITAVAQADTSKTASTTVTLTQ